MSDTKENQSSNVPMPFRHTQTLDEMLVENRSLKETLEVMLEFKRMLEHMFNNQKMLKLGVLQEYKAHFFEYFRKYRIYRKAFGNHLIKSVRRIDDTKFSECFNTNCRFPGCNRNDTDQLKEFDHQLALKRPPYYKYDIFPTENNENVNGESSTPAKEVEAATTSDVSNKKENPKTYSKASKRVLDDVPQQVEQSLPSKSPKISVEEEEEEEEALQPMETNAESVLLNNVNNDHNEIEIEKEEVTTETETEPKDQPKEDFPPTVVHQEEMPIVDEKDDIVEPVNSDPIESENDEKVYDDASVLASILAPTLTPTLAPTLAPTSASTPASTSVSTSASISVPESFPKLNGIESEQSSSSTSPRTKTFSPNDPQTPPVTPSIRVKTEFRSGIRQISVPDSTTPSDHPIEPTKRESIIRCKVKDCSMTFRHPSEANEHYKSHSKLFKCSVCNALFSTKAHVFRHFVVHNPAHPGQMGVPAPEAQDA